MKKRTWLLSTGMLTLAVLAGCATAPAPKTLADTAAATPQLSTLNKLLQDAGLADTLRGAGPYTVFAPTNEAFQALPKATLDALAKAGAFVTVEDAMVVQADVRASNGVVHVIDRVLLPPRR